MKNLRFISFIALIVALLLGGYAVMHLLVYILPMSEQGAAGAHLLYTVIVIALGLCIPYWMLKLLIRAARTRNSRERDIKLADIAKDKDQLSAR